MKKHFEAMINERYDYLNPGPSELGGGPMIYDKRVDVCYPLVFSLRGCSMDFDDFIHGIKLRLKYGGNGMLDLNHIYTLVERWEEI